MTEKKRSYSELRGDHFGGVQNQQNSLGGTGGCSVKQGDHKGGVFRERGFTVFPIFQNLVAILLLNIQKEY